MKSSEIKIGDVLFLPGAILYIFDLDSNYVRFIKIFLGFQISFIQQRFPLESFDDRNLVWNSFKKTNKRICLDRVFR